MPEAVLPRDRTSTHAALDARQRDPVFQDQSVATILLDTDLVIRAATRSYSTATERPADELLMHHVFEVFPDNPDAPDEQPTRALAESLDETMRTRRVQHMPPTRYDIPDPRRPGRFVQRRWMIAVSPVMDADTVIGACVQGRDVTAVEEDLVDALAGYRRLLADGELRTTSSRRRLAVLDAYLELVESHGRLAAEVAQLQEGLRTRPTIEQAKGIIMADRRCSPEEAFEVLRTLSMDSNVRLADVAAALVYQAQRR